MKVRGIEIAFTFAVLLVSLNAQADLIPTNDHDFYYRMGGGQGIPAPAYDGRTQIPLNVEADLGLHMNCGVFNPQLAIINSLNAIRNSFQNIQQNVINNATSAITLFPMYLIARADPSLYNLLNNGLLAARRDLELSTKSCEMMQKEMSQGKNPYADWASVSMGSDWKYHMSLAQDHPAYQRLAHLAHQDINLVKQKIEKDSGNQGIPWVHGSHIGRKTPYAGGQGQALIKVLHDTSVAGYNVILHTNRSYDDESPPLRNHANAHLIDTWANPQIAADWMTQVLGEEKITTYARGDKQSIPGLGLLPEHKKLQTIIFEKLQNLVVGKEAMTLEHLKAISAPGVMINSKVISAIRQQAPVTQAIIIEKLAQEVATAQLIDQALVARQILQTGSLVPVIEANPAAQNILNRALRILNQEIDNLLFHLKVRKALVSDTVSQLLSETDTHQHRATLIQPDRIQPVINHGAMLKNTKESP